MFCTTYISIIIAIIATAIADASPKLENVKLSVLQGIRGVCCEREYGELARAYDSDAADCDGLITALGGEDEAALDKEMNQWFDALSRIDGKPHIRRIFVLWQGLRSG